MFRPESLTTTVERAGARVAASPRCFPGVEPLPEITDDNRYGSFLKTEDYESHER